MIFVADTSSGICALAILEDTGEIQGEVFLPARSPELMDRMRAVAADRTLSKVAVATGPGSFTGLRMGASFALGLAMGLRIPIIPLPTLELQAARGAVPATALSEAGRGRLYYLVPGGEAALGEPADIPRTYPLVGFVSPGTEAALTASGHVFAAVSELRPFGAAAAQMLSSAREVAYGSLRLEYMHSFSAPV